MAFMPGASPYCRGTGGGVLRRRSRVGRAAGPFVASADRRGGRNHRSGRVRAVQPPRNGRAVLALPV